MILYGKPVAEEIRREFEKNPPIPDWQRVLAIVADETSDQHYLKAIKSAAAEWGVRIRETADSNEAHNMHDVSIIDIRKKPERVNRWRDVDGQAPESAEQTYAGRTSVCTPCTPEAIVAMLDYYKIPIAGKNVVILGRSDRVGKPLALLMMARDATVTVCHSKTPQKNMYDHIEKADILVCATGQKNLIDAQHIPFHCTVVNVGGDFDESQTEEYFNLIPYKGGVGCVTTAVLMRHVRI